jgi:hypothetical protein
MYILWKYLAEFTSETEMLRKEKLRENKSFTFNPPHENRVHYETIWGKYGTARHATTDKTIRRKKDATLIPDNYGKATDTHS